MEWPPASPRTPMTFPVAPTCPATTTYSPCVTAPRTRPRHPQRVPAPSSRGRQPSARPRQRAGPPGQRLANPQPPALPHRVSVRVQVDTEMLRWRDSFTRTLLSLASSLTLFLLPPTPPRGRRGRKECPTHQRPLIHFIFLQNSPQLLRGHFMDLLKWNIVFPTVLWTVYNARADRLFTGRELPPHSFLA